MEPSLLTPAAVAAHSVKASPDMCSAVHGRGFVKPRSAPRVLLKPHSVLSKWDATRAWTRRQISTFDYLTLLNSAAGRTQRDLSQYVQR